MKRRVLVAALLLYHFSGKLLSGDEQLSNASRDNKYLKMKPQNSENSRDNQIIIMVFIYEGTSWLFVSAKHMALNVSKKFYFSENFGKFCQRSVDPKCEVLRLA